MPNFTVDQIRECQYQTHQIRNMSVIAHVDHGKSTLTDSLLAKAGILSADAAGNARLTDTREDEALRGITIKSTGISLYYETNIVDGKETKGYLINLIDSPGHVDFSSEVTAALRVTDGALVVVDYIEGCAVQTETVLRQALAEKIKPVLMVNKIDRGILEQQVDGETMYQNFIRVIENANVIIATYENDDMGSQLQVSPESGTVAFGSALFGWAFTINRFADVLSKKFGIEKEKLQSKLWGDNYFDKKAKKWKNHAQADDGSQLTRVFVDLIMDPIIRLCKAAVGKDMEQVEKILSNLNIEIKKEDKELEGKKLMTATTGPASLEKIYVQAQSAGIAREYSSLADLPADGGDWGRAEAHRVSVADPLVLRGESCCRVMRLLCDVLCPA